MKALSFKSGLLMVMVLLNACGNNNNDKEPLKKTEIIRMAYENHDYQTAIVYTYDLYADDYNKMYLLDSLFYLFSYVENYTSASILADKLIDGKISNTRFIQTAANVYEKSENYTMASKLYEKLLLNHVADSLGTSYNLAKCYLELTQYNNSIRFAENVLKIKECNKTVLFIKDSKVTYQVGALNLIAMNYIKLKNFQEARKVLITVVKIAPFFKPAKENLEKLNMLMRL